MCDLIENNQEVPNWLQELERKREIRLKARLGHEAGAGAPCIQCNEKCPGLDLHFWRKICKNCKCSKENHDVHDDDIYGWAQFQLLGSKPNKIKKKIVLPGKKDEVELDWAPKGNAETIDKYLKTLAPESLPVKGSQAAQDRKQLLQKQIPIHDIDPTLCHELTDSELTKMQDYIKNMKNSAGVGQIIQVNEATTKFIADRYPKAVHSVETVHLVGEHKAESLNKQFDKLSVKNQKELDAFFDKVPMPANMTVHTNNLYCNQPIIAKNLPYLSKIDKNCADNPNLNHNFLEKRPKMSNITDLSISSNLAMQEMVPNFTEINRNLPNYAPAVLNIQSDQQKSTPVGNLRDLVYTTNDLTNSNYNNKPLGALSISESKLVPNQVNIGPIKDIIYDCDKSEGYKAELTPKVSDDFSNQTTKQCHKCLKPFELNEFAIFVEKSNRLYHSNCFKCEGCNQSLADLFYFYDKESDKIYCGRDFAKIRGIPRCKACDELIFVKEYCLAENCTFHLKHFCCFECDQALAGQNYVAEDSQPICLNCFEKLKANQCMSCMKVIKPDEQGVSISPEIHFHATDECFCCSKCKKVLFEMKILFRNNKLYCSANCFKNEQ